MWLHFWVSVSVGRGRRVSSSPVSPLEVETGAEAVFPVSPPLPFPLPGDGCGATCWLLCGSASCFDTRMIQAR